MTIGNYFKTNATDFVGKPAFDTFKFKQRGGDTAHPAYYDTILGRDKRNSSIPATLDAERPHYDPTRNITAGTVGELFN